MSEDAAAGPLMADDPRRLGPYELTGRLGAGGQGSVFLGTAPDGRRVAVKLLHADQTGDPLARERFIREANAAKKVARFCAAQVLDADAAGDRPYIVTEYVPGPSLHRLVAERGPIAGAALERLAIGTATALVAIHQAGIVHRDLKPGNVLIAPDGPRVIDFGIAKDTAATTMSSRIVGTPAFMAPEQLTGAPAAPSVDVFAWGATMAFVATGRAPFGMDTLPLVADRIINHEPDLGGMTDPIRALVADCLTKDPRHRPTARQLLLRLLDQDPAAPAAPARQPTPVADQVLAHGATLAAASTDPTVQSRPPRPATPPTGTNGQDMYGPTAAFGQPASDPRGQEVSGQAGVFGQAGSGVRGQDVFGQAAAFGQVGVGASEETQRVSYGEVGGAGTRVAGDVRGGRRGRPWVLAGAGGLVAVVAGVTFGLAAFGDEAPVAPTSVQSTSSPGRSDVRQSPGKVYVAPQDDPSERSHTPDPTATYTHPTQPTHPTVTPTDPPTATPTGTPTETSPEPSVEPPVAEPEPPTAPSGGTESGDHGGGSEESGS